MIVKHSSEPACIDQLEPRRCDERRLPAEWRDGRDRDQMLALWPIPAALESAVEVAYRNGTARTLASSDPDEIAMRYATYSFAAMEQLVDWATTHVLRGQPLSGYGIELGAGSGLLSAVVARSPDVSMILGVEICEDVARLIMPKIARAVLGDAAGKVVPVRGSFDDVRVPSGSLDFAIEIGSFHHSGQLATTLAEAARVLRKGGRVLAFDRVHRNNLNDAEVEEMLSLSYGPEFLRQMGYPDGARLTRRDNGEHEYRVREWRAAWTAAGFRELSMVQLHERDWAAHVVRAGLACLPREVTRFLPGRLRRQARRAKLPPSTYLRLALAGEQTRIADRDVNAVMLAPSLLVMRPTVFALEKVN